MKINVEQKGRKRVGGEKRPDGGELGEKARK